MPRYFTLQQAERTLPQVESAVRRAIRLKADFQTAEENMRDLKRKVMLSGGAMVNQESALAVRQARDAAATRLQEALTEIQEHGCLVKDLDIGLLDFPTLYRGQEVYLCWKLGENGIDFWHGVDEGFRGRKPIDEEFLKNHRGDSVS